MARRTAPRSPGWCRARTSSCVAQRDLIKWDAAAGGYRIDPADAEIILANWS
jgi:hypothetical protein